MHKDTDNKRTIPNRTSSATDERDGNPSSLLRVTFYLNTMTKLQDIGRVLEMHDDSAM